jgi:predicted nucleic acid-binding protein
MKRSPYLLDTSFLVRLLTREPLPLFKVAAGFLSRWTPSMRRLAVCDLVLAETYFALQHHYHYPKADALAALHALAGHPAIQVSAGAAQTLSLPDLASSRPGFVDRLIHGTASEAGATLVTFEKSARKLPGTLILEA